MPYQLLSEAGTSDFRHAMDIDLVIPVWNEEEALRRLLPEVPRGLFRQIIVVDCGSRDGTREVAAGYGATVVIQSAPGYGRACYEGFQAAAGTEVVAFLDGDYSDPPGALPQVLEPILQGRADLVIGSRTRGYREPGALAPQQEWGNRLVLALLALKLRRHLSDLGSCKAIRWQALDSLDMREMRYGWTVEMIVKSARAGFRIVEVPVGVRRRYGRSKVSGTFRGSMLAGYQLVRTVLRYA